MTSVISINHLTHIGLSFGTCNGIIFNTIQAGCGTTYPRIYSGFAEIFSERLLNTLHKFYASAEFLQLKFS